MAEWSLDALGTQSSKKKLADAIVAGSSMQARRGQERLQLHHTCAHAHTRVHPPHTLTDAHVCHTLTHVHTHAIPSTNCIKRSPSWTQQSTHQPRAHLGCPHCLPQLMEEELLSFRQLSSVGPSSMSSQTRRPQARAGGVSAS